MIQRIFGDIEALVLFLAIIAATVITVAIFNFVFNRYIKKSIKKLNSDPTGYQFVKHFVTGILYLVGVGWAMLTLPSMKAVAHTMLAGAGVITLIAGLASQQALSNIISGLFLVVFKPFKVNDRVKLRDSLVGTVEDITLRHTIIRDMENNRIVIPNSVMGNEVIVNLHMVDTKVCKIIDVGVSYDSDIDKAQQIIKEAVLNHPLHLDPRSPDDVAAGMDEVVVRVIGLGSSSVNLRTWAWAKDLGDGFVLNCDLFKNIKERFDEAGIEIPYNYQNVIIKKE